ncbi:MAG TPA: hypothetical protein VKU87_11410, partial [Thermomicrobiaceae bacterium]|nr:hypothetical protein [Thermomicrobiaceae bacterium]
MSLWKLEALRLWRTRRIVALAAIFIILGLGIPVLTHELPSLLKNSSGGVTIIAPPPTAATALHDFTSNASQIGTLVLVIVAAAGLALDANPALAAFYRSRTRSPLRLLLPRVIAVAVAGSICFAAGVICCWYQTDVLFGPLGVNALAAGFSLETTWIAFCVALTAFWAGLVRGVLPVAGMTIGSLLVVGFTGNIHPVARWLPTAMPASLDAF